MQKAWIIGVCGAAALALATCAREEEFDITGPTHRINHFIAKEFWHMKSQRDYQAFIESEIGPGFTEPDFVAYMERNGAECRRDPGDHVMYCRYLVFDKMAGPNSLWESMDVVDVWCFWSIPQVERPRVDYDRAGFAGARDFPTQSDDDYSQRHHIPPCKQLFSKDVRRER